MPKKGPRGENSKAVEARARKEDKKTEEKEKKEKAEEDAAWRDDDKMVLKKQSRMQQREASAAEKAAHKASLKAAYDEDMAAAASVTTSVKNAPAKLTRAEMQRRLDEEARREAEARGAAATPATTHLDEPLVENLNRLQVEESARSVGEAIHVLAGKSAKEDKHPEKRLQAAYKAFEERMMPTVKEENKNMRLSQWKQIIWKEWTKSPENPINQAKLQRQNEELS